MRLEMRRGKREEGRGKREIGCTRRVRVGQAWPGLVRLGQGRSGLARVGKGSRERKREAGAARERSLVRKAGVGRLRQPGGLSVPAAANHGAGHPPRH